MGQFTVQGVQYSNPQQVDQSTLKFATNIPPYNNVVPGGTWQPNFGMSIPQPSSFDASVPEANPVLFNQQPPPLTSGGIKIPNTSVVFRNPA